MKGSDIQIYIGDDMLDLYPDTTIPMTLQVGDLGDLTSRNVSYISQFRVPFTAKNHRIYQNSYDIRSSTRLPFKQQPIRVIQNAVEVVSSGYHVLKKASTQYEMIILFREIGFFNAISTKRLWDLSAAPFKARFNTARTFRNTTSGLIHPICFCGDLLSGNAGLVEIPFWYYKDIVDQIFEDAGYQKTGSVFSDSKYNSMVVNASGTIAGYNPEFVSKRSVDVFVATTQVINLPDGTPKIVNFTGINNGGSNPLGYWDGTSKYLTNDADIPSTQTVFDANVRFNLTFTGNGLDIRVRILSGPNTVIDVVDLINVTGSPQTVRFDYTGDNPGATTFPYQLNGTSNGIQIQIQRINSTTGTINVTAGNMQIYPLTKPTVFTSGPLSANPYAYYADLLPDMSQSDFIRDFMIRFGLLCSEENGTIEFKSYNEIITTPPKDITSKRVSGPDDVSFNPLDYAMENIFDYSSADDISDSVDSSGSIDIDNANISTSKTIYVSPFARTLTATTLQILCAQVTARNTDPVKALNWWNEAVGFRLLLVRDKYSYEPTYPVGSPASDYKVAYFDDDNQADTMRFQKFIDDNYSLLIEALQDARLINRNYLLEEIDISVLSFLEPVFDTDARFLLNTVGPFLPGKSTKFNMLKIGLSNA